MPSTLHQARARGRISNYCWTTAVTHRCIQKEKGVSSDRYQSCRLLVAPPPPSDTRERDARFHTHPTNADPRPFIVSLPHTACRPGRFESRKRPARNPSRLGDARTPASLGGVSHVCTLCEDGCFGACLRGMAAGMQEAPIRDKLHSLIAHSSASLAQALTERPHSRE